jgi:leader peptidase (prepilin peptidase)/N-methyltransferase
MTKKEAMGFGDVKLLAAIGLICGVRGILIVLIITILTSGLWFILLLLTKKIQRGENKPLGPYIVAACALYLMFQEQVNQIVNWYLAFY